MQRFQTVGMVAAMGFLTAGAWTQAAVTGISINFGTEHAAVGGTAGRVPLGNWNNITGNTSGDTPFQSAVDSDNHVVSGMSMTWSSPNTWNTNGLGFSGEDKNLFSGYLDQWPTVTITGISYTNSDVYVYQASSNGWRGYGVSLAVVGTGAVDPATYYGSTLGDVAGYIQATQTTPAGNGDAPQASYLLFHGNTATGFTISEVKDGRWKDNNGIAGIQIVAVPEPTTMTVVLLAASGISLMRRRRQVA